MMCQCTHCKNEFHVQSAKSGPNAPLCPLCGKEFITAVSGRPFEWNFAHWLGIIALFAVLLPAAGLPLALAGIISGIKKRSVTAILLNIFALVLSAANGVYGIFFSRLTN